MLWDIESDPALAGTKLIAEAWDAAGLYQVGSFIGDRWQEWNGRFRDDARRFWKGDDGRCPRIAYRLLGSPDLYGHEERDPEQSINFVTCHDGFTLQRPGLYNHKHNEDNGEDNRDGTNDNLSWNCGAEGPTDDPAVEALRARQVRNFLTGCSRPARRCCSWATRSAARQRGNNNAYCQDNERSWLDWRRRAARRRAALRHGVGRVPFRRDIVGRPRPTLNELLCRAPIEYHGVALRPARLERRSLTRLPSLWGRRVAVPHPRDLTRRRPLRSSCPGANRTRRGSRTRWRRCVDTSLPPSPRYFSPLPTRRRRRAEGSPYPACRRAPQWCWSRRSCRRPPNFKNDRK